MPQQARWLGEPPIPELLRVTTHQARVLVRVQLHQVVWLCGELCTVATTAPGSVAARPRGARPRVRASLRAPPSDSHASPYPHPPAPSTTHTRTRALFPCPFRWRMKQFCFLVSIQIRSEDMVSYGRDVGSSREEGSLGGTIARAGSPSSSLHAGQRETTKVLVYTAFNTLYIIQGLNEYR